MVGLFSREWDGQAIRRPDAGRPGGSARRTRRSRATPAHRTGPSDARAASGTGGERCGCRLATDRAGETSPGGGRRWREGRRHDGGSSWSVSRSVSSRQNSSRRRNTSAFGGSGEFVSSPRWVASKRFATIPRSERSWSRTALPSASIRSRRSGLRSGPLHSLSDLPATPILSGSWTQADFRVFFVAMVSSRPHGVGRSVINVGVSDK